MFKKYLNKILLDKDKNTQVIEGPLIFEKITFVCFVDRKENELLICYDGQFLYLWDLHKQNGYEIFFDSHIPDKLVFSGIDYIMFGFFGSSECLKYNYNKFGKRLYIDKNFVLEKNIQHYNKFVKQLILFDLTKKIFLGQCCDWKNVFSAIFI